MTPIERALPAWERRAIPPVDVGGQQSREGDRYVRVPRTRFVTRAMLPLFDMVVHPHEHPGASMPGPRPSPPTVDVAASLRAMWD